MLLCVNKHLNGGDCFTPALFHNLQSFADARSPGEGFLYMVIAF